MDDSALPKWRMVLLLIALGACARLVPHPWNFTPIMAIGLYFARALDLESRGREIVAREHSRLESFAALRSWPRSFTDVISAERSEGRDWIWIDDLGAARTSAA